MRDVREVVAPFALLAVALAAGGIAGYVVGGSVGLVLGFAIASVIFAAALIGR